MDGLVQLARFETRSSLLRKLEVPGRYPSGNCTIEKQKVYRRPLGQSVWVDCLVVYAAGAPTDRDGAIALLQEWMEAERLDYYRITITGHNDPADKTHLIYLRCHTPSFYGFAVTCGITFTFGGLRIDPAGHVLDRTGQPIGGLTAAGVVCQVTFRV